MTLKVKYHSKIFISSSIYKAMYPPIFIICPYVYTIFIPFYVINKEKFYIFQLGMKAIKVQVNHLTTLREHLPKFCIWYSQSTVKPLKIQQIVLYLLSLSVENSGSSNTLGYPLLEQLLFWKLKKEQQNIIIPKRKTFYTFPIS